VFKVKSASYVLSAHTPGQFPDLNVPEVAFAGRSNVGKSSLMNALMGRSGLVKVSSRPGYTRSINFFLVNEAVAFVDLPGYGFAEAPRPVREAWKGLVESYVEGRGNLAGVVCIFDIRRTPDAMDLALVDYLRARNRAYWIVFNKADKIPQPRRIQRMRTIMQAFPGIPEKFYVVSARTGEGVSALLDETAGRLSLE